MKPWTRSAAFAVAILAAATPAPARSDEAIALRLAALRSLVDPNAPRVPIPPRSSDTKRRLDPPARELVRCSEDAWWRSSSYAAKSRTDDAIRDASARFAIDEHLIRSVIRQESAFDPHAVSRKGAMGLMQLMPATARALGVVCPFDPRENVLGGSRYLRRLHDRFGSWKRAISAYHAGPTRVARGRIPRVTRRYTNRVLRGWDAARRNSASLRKN